MQPGAPVPTEQQGAWPTGPIRCAYCLQEIPADSNALGVLGGGIFCNEACEAASRRDEE